MGRMITRRVVLIFFAAVLLFSAGCATVPTRQSGRAALNSQIVKIGGKDYIPLSVLARYYQTKWEWDPVLKKAVLLKGNNVFVFYVGMEYALLNGRTQKLSSAVSFYEGAPAVPADFALNTVVNILGAPQVTTGPQPPLIQKYVVRKIAIDAGHGGEDPGAIGRNGLREKDLVLDIAKRVKEELVSNGIEVVSTRDRDRFISLNRRTQIANDNDVDFFVSIHANSAKLKGARGFEVYYLSNAVDDNARAVEAAENSFLKFNDSSFYLRNTKLEATVWDLVYTENRQESIELARYIAKAVDDSTSLKNRGIKSARFYVLKGVQMPSVLVEIGFISNPAEEKNLCDLSYRQVLASSIARGILNYKKVYESTDGFTK